MTWTEGYGERERDVYITHKQQKRVERKETWYLFFILMDVIFSFTFAVILDFVFIEMAFPGIPGQEQTYSVQQMISSALVFTLDIRGN